MRKPDDDLKINISDIFGGELPGPSESIEEPSATAAANPASPAPSPAETENQFQEWMNTRNAELEAKAQELELRLQDMQAQMAAGQPAAEKSSEPTPPPQEVPVPAPEPASDSPIDFNAPIAPPFMGIASTPAVSAPGNPVVSAEIKENPTLSDPQKVDELKKLQADHEFLMLYDEFRNIIAYELKDLVGEKKTYTMLGRTVELARTKYPEVFRNANWDAAGNLLEDGSVDSQRVIENKNAMDPTKANLVLDTALSSLLNLRLQAVEKGLGTGLRNKVRAHLFQWITEKIQKAGREGKDTTILRRLNGYVSQV